MRLIRNRTMLLAAPKAPALTLPAGALARFTVDAAFPGVTDGAHITVDWPDATVNGNNLTIAPGTNAAILRKASLNGHDVVELPGDPGTSFARTLAGSASFKNTAVGFTLLAVLRFTADTSGGAVCCHASSGGSAAGWNVVINGLNIATYAGPSNSYTRLYTYAAPDPWHVVAIRSSAAANTTEFWIDGVLATTIASKVTFNGGLAQFAIGRFYGDDTSLCAPCQIAEVAQWNSVFDDATLASTIQYYKQYFGLA